MSAASGPRPDFTGLLDPADVQHTLKLSSRRSARELIVREMEHVLVGRTPMTTTVWLADWLERQRRNPRQLVARPDPSPKIESARGRRASKSRSALPPPHRRVKSG